MARCRLRLARAPHRSEARAGARTDDGRAARTRAGGTCEASRAGRGWTAHAPGTGLETPSHCVRNRLARSLAMRGRQITPGRPIAAETRTSRRVPRLCRGRYARESLVSPRQYPALSRGLRRPARGHASQASAGARILIVGCPPRCNARVRAPGMAARAAARLWRLRIDKVETCETGSFQQHRTTL